MKLTIIMPCFNVADTVGRALDSIAMQVLDYDYEIIVIDDASTDSTEEVVRAHDLSRSCLRYLKNEENRGNARSFHRGLSEARGEYFCVLDGDDYYTVCDKLQKQITFLEEDVRREYVAVASNFLIDFENGNIHIPNRVWKGEFTYADLLLRHHPYCHTATYVYRNIFKGNVPEYFDMQLYRGDTPRTIFHLMYSGKKVKVLDFVGSAYSYTYHGIWSALDERAHYEYQIDFYKEHKKHLRTSFEKNAADSLIEINQALLDEVVDGAMDHYPAGTIAECLHEIESYAGIFAFRQREFIFREVYSSEYLDTLLASIGYVARQHNEAYRQESIDDGALCILISRLVPRGGGIFTEIKELAEMYPDKEVHIIQTFDPELSDDAVSILSGIGENIHVAAPPSGCADIFDWLSRRIVEISPYRIYCYCSHQDVHSVAVLSQGLCENVCLFSFDHGFVLGLNNPNLSTIAAKRPVDYQLLSNAFEEKLIYLPAWSHGVATAAEYVPFQGDSAITTASGAARYYKVDGERPYRYLDAIKMLMLSAEATHYHFGPLPKEVKDELACFLAENDLPESRFRHIEWSSDIPSDLLEYGVDLFIEPFPTVSYKLTLNVLSAGIPVAAWQSLKRMSVTDFIPADSLMWRTIEELVQKVRGLDASRLKQMSQHAIEYFDSTHRFDVVKPFVVENRSMAIGEPRYYVDDEVHDISEYFGVFDLPNIHIMEYLDRRDRLLDRSRHLRRSRSLRIGYCFHVLMRRLCGSSTSDQPLVDEFLATTDDEFISKHGESQARIHLDAIHASKTFRLGRYLTWPSVVLHRMARHMRRE